MCSPACWQVIIENICVVGDDDQSIYKFRGATITNILEFEKQFKDAKTIRLEQNYRSTGNILNAANEVIRNNVGRKGKELWTDHGDGAKIRLHRSDSQEGEAAYIADTIREGVEQAENGEISPFCTAITSCRITLPQHSSARAFRTACTRAATSSRAPRSRTCSPTCG